ncbi:MAG: hypothetical protein V4566_04115 [Pseudomonadota bacterium]
MSRTAEPWLASGGSLGTEACEACAYEDELAAVSGVGEARLKRHSRDFLAVINAPARVAVALALAADHPYN